MAYRFWVPGELASDVKAISVLLPALRAGKNSPPPSGPALSVSWTGVPPLMGMAHRWKRVPAPPDAVRLEEKTSMVSSAVQTGVRLVGVSPGPWVGREAGRRVEDVEGLDGFIHLRADGRQARGS